MFHSFGSGGGVYEHTYVGPDAENDAKLAFARESKKMQNGGTVEIKEIKAERWREAGYKVVCMYSEEGLKREKLRIEYEDLKFREEMRIEHPDWDFWKPSDDEDLEYRMDYGRKQNPRRKKKKPVRRFEEYNGLEPLSFEEDNLPTPSQGCAVKESLKKRILTDPNPGSPPTHNYWYGTHGRRWAGRGKKAPWKNWKSKRLTKYHVE